MTDTLDFEEWASSMESEYEKFAKMKNASFKGWFDEIKLTNAKVNKEYNSFIEFWENWEGDTKEKPKQNSIDQYFVTLTIAHSFYEDWVEYDYKLKKGCDLAAGTTYANTIKRYLNKTGIVLKPIDIKKTNKSYWFEICSAFQRRYGLFATIQDLNNFLTRVCSASSCDRLKDYGLYVRDLHDLCVAYAILHEYSFEEAKELIINCKNIVTDKQNRLGILTSVNKTLTQRMIDDFDNESEGLIKISEEDFKSKVMQNAKKFIPYERDNHWSTLKNILLSILKLEASSLDDLDDIKKIDKANKWRTFNSRTSLLFDKLCDKFSDSFEDKMAEISGSENYASFIFHELKPKGDLIDSYEFSISWIRKLLIVYSMIQKNEEGGWKNANNALDELDRLLEDYNLRGLFNKFVGGNTVETATTDKFDWFIIECIKRDEDCCKSDSERISGLRAFCQFLDVKLI